MNIAVVAGGTGGHIFPALSTITEMRELSPESTFRWITTDRGNEKELAEKYNVTPLFLKVEGIQRRASLQPIRAIFKFELAFFKMVKYLKAEKIDRVVAFGGYVCAPVLMAAKFLKIPFYLQEQNSVPGMVNRMFGKKAEKLFLGVPLAEGFEIETTIQLTGTPIRKREDSYDGFQFPFTISDSENTILICGGSQGAVSMNRVLTDAVKWLAKNDFTVIWQTGYPGYDEVKETFGAEKNVHLLPSMDDLYPYYDKANLLMGRSGASTISEASLFHLPTILIPLPWSAENHQWFNAGYAEDAGWAIRMLQDDETSTHIIDTVKDILQVNIEKKKEMRAAAGEASRPDAAKVVAKEVLGC